MAAGSQFTDGAEQDGAIGFGGERRKDVRQKEDGGVQERHHAKAWPRLPNQIAWQSLRARAVTSRRGVPGRDEEASGRRSPCSCATIVRPVRNRRRVRLQTLAHDDCGNRLRRAARHASDIARRRHTAAGSLLQALAIAMHGLDVGERMSHRIDNRRQHRIVERSRAGSGSRVPRGACRPGPLVADRPGAATLSAAGILRLSWMSQTQTSPVSSRPRIRRRVASASALNRVFHLD